MEPQNQPIANNQPIMPTMMPMTMPTMMPPAVPPAPIIIPPVNGSDHNGDKKVGPIIATLVIVLILIIAALYLFASKINQPAIPDDNAVSAGNLDGTATANNDSQAPAAVQPTTGTSTDIQSLQNDLDNSTNGLDNQNF